MTRAALVAVVLSAAVWGVLHVGWYSHGQIVDYGVYQLYGDDVARDHLVPYRDFNLEYPPAALPVFVAPALVARFDYRKLFQVADGRLSRGRRLRRLLHRRVGGRRAHRSRAPCARLGRPLALRPLAGRAHGSCARRSAAPAVDALRRARRDRVRRQALAGGARAARSPSGSHAARAAAPPARWLAVAAGTAAAWFLPFVVLSPGGVAHSFHAQFARPLQLESLGASMLIALHHVVGYAARRRVVVRLAEPQRPGHAHAAAIVTSVAGLLALAALYVAFARGHGGRRRPPPLRRRRGRRHARVRQGLLAAVPDLAHPARPARARPARRSARARSLFSALVLTQLWFPERYWPLANCLRAHAVVGAARAQPRRRRARGGARGPG